MQYRVGKNRSILVPAKYSDGKPRGTNRVLQPGEIVPDGVLEKSAIPACLKRGTIVPADGRASPAVSQEAPVIHTGEMSGEGDPLAVNTRDADPAPPKPFKYEGKWNHDPANLEGKEHDELLTMIFEKDPNADLDAIKTEQEAIELLSLDFEPAETGDNG